MLIANFCFSYPLVYCAIVLPLCVVRWVGFSREANGQQVPSAATLAVVTIYGLSGAANVVLFLSTRPHLLLFAKEPHAPVPTQLPVLPVAHDRLATDATAVKEGHPEDHVETLGALPSARDWNLNAEQDRGPEGR